MSGTLAAGEVPNGGNPVFDAPKVIAASVILGTLGYAVFLGMPIMVGVLVDRVGFTNAQAGYITGTENLGMFLGSLIVSALVQRANRRHVAAVGLAVAIAVNFSSQFIDQFNWFIALRLLSGIGAGAVYALAVAVIAGSSNTVRNFTYLIFSLVLTNAIVLYTFPHIAELFGAPGIFLTFCGLFSLGFVTLHWLPGGTRERADAASATEPAPATTGPLVPPRLILICLFGVFSYYFLIGVFWAYAERIGVELGFTSTWMGSALSMGTLLSLVACVMAYTISRWFGPSRPLIAALLLLVVINIAFALNYVPLFFIVSIFAVMGLWNFVDIYQMGTVADMDHSGRFAALVPGAQALPLAMAPALAGFLLDTGWDFEHIVWLWGGSAALACCAYSFVYFQLRRRGIHVVD